MVDVNHGGDGTWADVRAASPIQGAAWEHMKQHMLLTLSGSGVAAVAGGGVAGGFGSNAIGAAFYFSGGIAGGVGTIVIGGRRGGEMVYRYHVGMSEAGGGDLMRTSRPAGG